MADVNWENVLILQTSFLGDMVLTLPLISEVRRRFPVKRLSVVCSPVGKEILQDHPAIDEIIVDDKKGRHRGWSGLTGQASALKEKNFSLALTPHKSLRSAWLLYSARIPNRVGFRQSKGWFLFDHRADRDPRRHDVERNLSILQPLGVSLEQCQRDFDLPLDASIDEAVEGKLRALGVDQQKLTIGVNPGSVWPTKRWWSRGFAELIQLIKRKVDCQVLLFGGNDDAAVVDDVARRAGGAAISLVGKISLRELAAAINRCRVFVTNDSGPMHIAVARKISTVAIFCATTPDLGFFPYSDNAIVVHKDLSCRPCASHGGRRCPLGSEECIREIRAEVVLKAVEKLLHAKERRPRQGQLSFRPEFMAA